MHAQGNFFDPRLDDRAKFDALWRNADQHNRLVMFDQPGAGRPPDTRLFSTMLQ